MSTLWQREKFLRICSKEELAEKAHDIEATMPVNKVERHGATWMQGLSSKIVSRADDRMGRINEDLQIVYILEFKRSTDRDEGFL